MNLTNETKKWGGERNRVKNELSGKATYTMWMDWFAHSYSQQTKNKKKTQQISIDLVDEIEGGGGWQRKIHEINQKIE